MEHLVRHQNAKVNIAGNMMVCGFKKLVEGKNCKFVGNVGILDGLKNWRWIFLE